MTMNQKSTANTSKQKKEEEGGGKACRCFQTVKQLVSYHF
jgi:hypothetical protein